MEEHQIHCPICLTSKPPIQFTTLSCQCQACSDCLVEWTTMKIQEQSLTIEKTLPCILPQCGQPFTIQTIYSTTQLQIHKEKLDQVLLQGYLSRDQEIRKCPKSGCSYAGIINLKSKCKENLNCELCGTSWKDKSHFTFSQNLKNRITRIGSSTEETLTWFWKKIKTRDCPGCHVTIRREQGCSHLTCLKCGQEFCWDCGSAWPRHKFFPHAFNILLGAGLYIGLPALVLRRIGAIPIVKATANRFIKPVVNRTSGFLGKALRGGLKFLFTNLPLIGLAGAFSSHAQTARNGFGMLTLVSMGIIWALDWQKVMLKTIGIDFMIFGCFMLKNVYKRKRRAAYLNQHAEILYRPQVPDVHIEKPDDLIPYERLNLQ